jgi:hypothetical protein
MTKRNEFDDDVTLDEERAAVLADLMWSLTEEKRERIAAIAAERRPMRQQEVEAERASILGKLANGSVTRGAQRGLDPWDGLLDPLEEALAEAIDAAVFLMDTPPSGPLDSRVNVATIELISRGSVVYAVSRNGLIRRAAQIENERRREAGVPR